MMSNKISEVLKKSLEYKTTMRSTSLRLHQYSTNNLLGGIDIELKCRCYQWNNVSDLIINCTIYLSVVQLPLQKRLIIKQY